MPKFAKYALIGFAALLSLLLIGIAVIASTFDPNDYKPEIIRLVQEKKQRTLSIPGTIKLTFFPKIGADLGKVSISEHGGKAEFASVDSARVSLELMPLLSKQLIIDRIAIDGIRANITRFKDGSTNFDDLLSKEESGQQVKFDIDKVSVSNAKIVFDDRLEGRMLEISRLNVETGRIASGTSSKFEISADVVNNRPVVAAKIAAKSGFMIDFDAKHYVLKDLDAELHGKLDGFSGLAARLKGDADLKPAAKQFALNGIVLALTGKYAGQAIEARLDAPKLAFTDKEASGAKLTGSAKLADGVRTVTVNFSTPSFTGSPRAFKIPALTLDAAIKDAQLNAKASLTGALAGDIDKLLFSSPQLRVALDGKQGERAINGALTTPFAANLKAQTIDLSAIAAAFTLPNPGGGILKLKADGRASANLGKQTVSATLKGNLDESAFDAKIGLAKFSPLAYVFDIGIDRLDADRYRAKPPAAAAATAANAPEQPIDLAVLKNLNASGNLRIGAFKVNNIKATNVRLGLNAAAGKAEVSPLAANLYGGTLTGALSATASTPPRFAVRQTMAGVAVGALLKDAIGKEPVEGRGNVQLDVAAQGTTVAQLKRALSGTARIELHDGAVHGINVAQAIRKAKATIGAIQGGAAPQAGTGSSGEKTDFSELSGSFHIANGIARNDDLSAKSPLLRIGGSGQVNLGEDRLDYLVKATVVSTLQGQGGPELQALKGVTVPVRLSGPFSAIGWKIDFAGMASELAKQKFEEKKEEAKTRLQDELQKKLKGLFGR